MKNLIARAKAFFRSEAGPTATEYAVMLALIVSVVIGAVTLLGSKVSGVFTAVTTALP